MRADRFSSSYTGTGYAGAVFRTAFMLFLFIAVASLLIGCGPGAQQNGQNPASADANTLPEITDEIIHERINDAYVRDVPEENGAGDPIFWNFDRDEPKEISIVEKHVEGRRATIVLGIKTGSAPGRRNPRQLEGRIRTEWELRTGWALRKWEIVDTENISMKYKNLPRTTEDNSNR